MEHKMLNFKSINLVEKLSKLLREIEVTKLRRKSDDLFFIYFIKLQFGATFIVALRNILSKLNLLKKQFLNSSKLWGSRNTRLIIESKRLYLGFQFFTLIWLRIPWKSKNWDKKKCWNPIFSAISKFEIW